MRCLAPFFFFVLTLSGAERWVEFRSGPFEVASQAGERIARERLDELEQLSYAIEQIAGASEEAEPLWPLRLIILPDERVTPPAPGFARDAWVAAIAPRGPLSSSIRRFFARLLIQSEPGRLPAEMEEALASLFSTLEVKGAQVVLGAPPPEAERTRAWAEAHLLATSEEYYGKMRTLIYNLRRGIEAEPAYRNAFGKTPAEVGREAEQHLQAGRFSTVQLKRKPLNPEKDFRRLEVDPARRLMLIADLALADPARSEEARAGYEALLKISPGHPAALEGLALLAERQGRAEQAYSLLAKAVESAEAGPTVCLAYARLEKDPARAAAALERAARSHPRWGLPHYELALREPDPEVRIERLAAAARREPQNPSYWEALAQAQEKVGRFTDAARSWAAALAAAPTEQERSRLRAARQQADELRRRQQEEARLTKAEEEKRRIEELKRQALESIQAAVDKANRENPPLAPSSGKVEPWWEGPRPDARVTGTLRQVDCLGRQARLVIEQDDRRLIRLLVGDAAVGFGEAAGQSFACGPQKPARRVKVEYFKRPDPNSGTDGEVAVIEFP